MFYRFMVMVKLPIFELMESNISIGRSEIRPISLDLQSVLWYIVLLIEAILFHTGSVKSWEIQPQCPRRNLLSIIDL